MLTGGCFCGLIRYKVAGSPFNAATRHCSICRRTTGAPFVTWFSVRPGKLCFTHGQPAQFRASGERDFSRKCGTQLVFRSIDIDEVGTIAKRAVTEHACLSSRHSEDR